MGSIYIRGNEIFNITIFFALVSRTSAALSSTTQHAMPTEFDGKWAKEYINIRIPLPTLLLAGNRMTLKKSYNFKHSIIYSVAVL